MIEWKGVSTRFFCAALSDVRMPKRRGVGVTATMFQNEREAAN
jgi:hypothetical protein